ncbi:hypothetical protein EGI32_02905 [Ferruginibacter sp. HRS2-29]|nr:hypothetical protein [Ferruginibacter sp. HRS2-29]
MSFWDYVLLPVYYFILSRLVHMYKRKYLSHSKELQFYFTWCFRLKMLCAVTFVLLTQYYFKMGDTMMYFDEGVNLHKYFFKDPANLRFLFAPCTDYWDYKVSVGNTDYEGYLLNEGNFMPMRLVAFLSFFAFRNFTAITLIFSTFSFFGLWKLFEAFVKLYPKLKRKMALSFLFLPSVIFWCSTILKDTICITCIGMILFSFFEVIYWDKKVREHLFRLVFFSFILFLTKPYIAVVLIPCCFILFMLNYKEHITNPLAKKLFIPFLLVLLWGGLYLSSSALETVLGDFTFTSMTESIERKQKSFELIAKNDGGSFFEIGEIVPTPMGLLSLAPKIINAVFFRPYLWESSNAIMLFSALESLALLMLFIYTLLRAKFIYFFTILFTNNVVIFCFIFSVIFAFFVGISTPNFGSLVRYKIPCTPFFCAMLMIISSKIRKSKN